MLNGISRLLPAAASIPKPGEDIQQAPWLGHMRSREVAMFCFDKKSGQIVKITRETPQIPIDTYCVAYRSRFYAKLGARGQIMTIPNMICALYTAKGKWIETVSADGVRQRNEGLEFLLLLLRFPLWTVIGGLEILFVLTWLRIGQIHPHGLSASDWIACVIGGTFLGGATHGITYLTRLFVFKLRSRPALEQIGSPKRERFYKQLAKEQNLLIPKEVTFEEVEIKWQNPETHAQWAGLLEHQTFQRVGQYRVREGAGEIEFWIKPDENFTACIVNYPAQGMWITVSTRLQDGSSLEVANKDETGLDQHRKQTTIYLGPQASAEDVLEQARALRPKVGQITPTIEAVLTDYANSWREYIEWRRSRGTTAEEYKRIDLRRHARKTQGSR